MYVNVKIYDWEKSFYKTTFGVQATIRDLERQARIYAQYANEVKFVFKGRVLPEVQQALSGLVINGIKVVVDVAP